jgi:cell wall-associated NlpC family hydrolase
MRLIILTGIIALMASCSTMKKTSVASERPASSESSNPVFIDNISFRPGSAKAKQASQATSIDKVSTSKESYNINSAEAIEVLPALRFKYSILLDAPVEDLKNHEMLQFIDEWYGTRYRLGGHDKSGIDCSAFTQYFLTAVYGMEVSRTCREQYLESRRISKKQLQEGDLVFFKTRGKTISHVGIYLRNNKFIHASTSSGVMISDLSEEYFDKRYAGAGRM